MSQKVRGTIAGLPFDAYIKNGKLSFTRGGGTSAEASVLATAFERRNYATAVVMGRALGLASDAAGRNNFRISDAAAQTGFMASSQLGAGGAAGSTTMSIVPWAVGETLASAEVAVTNMGNSLVTYVSGGGFRPLAEKRVVVRGGVSLRVPAQGCQGDLEAGQGDSLEGALRRCPGFQGASRDGALQCGRACFVRPCLLGG